jgi:hypothetical protein
MDDKQILQELKAIKRALTCENTSSGVISDPCCPITNTLLDDIKTAIETLDISVDNLVLNTDTLEINTDELETLLTTLNNITQIENDESQVLLTDVKTNLQTIINKLNQPCGGDTIKVDICNIADSPVDTYANDTFQITDCNGLPIGTPQDVKKTVVLNKLTTQICNAQELADLIAEAIVFPETPTLVNYNKEEELIITPDTIYSILSNTVHGYGLSVSGTGTTSTITINGGTAVPISSGYSKQVEFSTTNDFTIDIFCDVNDVIRLIKQY